MTAKSKSKPTVLSAFTGGGGLDVGLEAAGFSTIACIERDPIARETLIANRSHWRLLEPMDINEIDPDTLPKLLGIKPGELDVLASGPPCQPFSKAAQWAVRQHTGMQDPRSKCIYALLHLVRVLLPKVLLIENVRGFVYGQCSAKPLIEHALQEINCQFGTKYKLEHRVINAVDYGIPQRRERVILLALHNGLPFQWPNSTHTKASVRAWDALAGLSEAPLPKANGKWADLLPSIPEGQNYLWHTPQGGGRPLFGYRTRYWSFLLKLAKAEPAWTLPAQPGPATGPFHWDNRPLTIKEMLRLQTFPTNWKVLGNYREQVLQIGNATPPLLAEIISRVIGKQVFGMTYDTPPKLCISRKRRIPPPAKIRSVPSKYHHLEGEHAPHLGAGKGPKPIIKSEAA